MQGLKKILKALHRLYVGIGMAAMGGVAALVIFTVIARYFFSLSWKELEEFVTALFAFTTFWGLGIAVLEGEHVAIDILTRALKPAMQKWLGAFSLLAALAVDLTVCVYSFRYVALVGEHLSPGMGVPMGWLYGVMPVSFILCAVCIVLKIVTLAAGGAEKRPA